MLKSALQKFLKIVLIFMKIVTRSILIGLSLLIDIGLILPNNILCFQIFDDLIKLSTIKCFFDIEEDQMRRFERVFLERWKILLKDLSRL